MGTKEAKKYIKALHKKQDNPYLWPDYLTGLPEKPAIIKWISEVYGKPLKHILYVRIANIHPYLIKYGPDRHADIIQWAAAVLKTTADKYKAFVGAFNSHDFIAVCDAKAASDFMDEASKVFNKKALSFYSREDLQKGSVISFIRDGKKVNAGFMKLISSGMCAKTDTPKDQVVQHLGSLCEKAERDM
ncbi:MAG: hypothetical protein Q8J64_03775 [Thermodesulfovibrionales bacterium]|nr:hypothetical protein [Thermodesulfovibrionales bacterium]